jgi:hypothetical protein
MERHRSTCETVSQRLALEELHDEERHTVLDAHVVHRADVWMAEAADGARFPLEPIELSGSGGTHRAQDLDGDGAIEPGISRTINFSHAAGTKRRQNLVRADLSSGHESHAELTEGANRTTQPAAYCIEG